MSEKERPLTRLMQAFADKYLETGNATQSYIDAGYKASKRSVAEANARKLLADPRIRAFVDERLAEKESEQIAKQDEVLQFLSSVMRGEKTEQIPLGLGMGEQKLVNRELDGSARIRAAELLGKRYGLWVDRQNIEGGLVVFKGDDQLED